MINIFQYKTTPKINGRHPQQNKHSSGEKKTAELWTLLGERLKALCTLRVRINKIPLIQTDPVSTKTLLGCFYPGVLRELEWRIRGLRMEKESFLTGSVAKNLPANIRDPS